jgi:hypothetical protein
MNATRDRSVPRRTGHSSSRPEASGAAKTRTFFTHCLGLRARMTAGTRDRRRTVSDDPSESAVTYGFYLIHRDEVIA